MSVGTNMRIGVYDGCFNPVNHAHLRVAEIAREAFDLDIVFFEASNNFYKRKGMIDVKHRINMLKLATRHARGMEIGHFEADLKDRHPYTIEILDYYQQTYKDATVFYICGGDVLDILDKFYHIEELQEKYRILCVSRENYGVDDIIAKSKRLDRERILTVDGIIGRELSGTAIREIIRKNYTIKWLVPDAVKDYIEENELYTENVD